MGAEVVPGQGTSFRVWAPDRRRVALVFEEARSEPLDLQPEEDGYFHLLCRDARAGTRYRFRLDDDGEPYADPASRYQPQGPFGPSEIVDPLAFEWTDQDWPGISLSGQVILYGPLVHFAHTARAGVRDWSERDQRFGPTLASTRWYWDNYIKPPQGKTDDPRANPLLVENLEGVAPALITFGTLDTYGEECLAYARLLDRAGIDVRVTEYPRLNHGYMVHGWLPEEDRSTLGYDAACETYDHVRQLAYRQVA